MSKTNNSGCWNCADIKSCNNAFTNFANELCPRAKESKEKSNK